MELTNTFLKAQMLGLGQDKKSGNLLSLGGRVGGISGGGLVGVAGVGVVDIDVVTVDVKLGGVKDALAYIEPRWPVLFMFL